jgi:hypothetical protein
MSIPSKTSISIPNNYFLIPSNYPVELIKESIKNESTSLTEKDIKEGIGYFEKIGRCVTGYRTRQGFGGKLAGFFYRIWNAIKAVFGQSDLQISRRTIDKIYTNHDLNKLTNIINPVHKALFGKKIIIKNSNELLNCVVAINSELSKSKVLHDLGKFCVEITKLSYKPENQDKSFLDLVTSVQNKYQIAKYLINAKNEALEGTTPSFETLKSDPQTKKLDNILINTVQHIFNQM